MPQESQDISCQDIIIPQWIETNYVRAKRLRELKEANRCRRCADQHIERKALIWAMVFIVPILIYMFACNEGRLFYAAFEL